MSKLCFYYAAMNAGKSSKLLQTSFNYKERGMKVDLYIPQLIQSDYISSRIGIKEKANVFGTDFDFFKEYSLVETKPNSILIDEAQFLTKHQVFQICKIVDELNIPVSCFGIRTDFQGESFEGSRYLLCLSDELVELYTICPCGNRAIMNQRIQNNKPVLEGKQVVIGGDKYISLCRKCFMTI